MVDPKPLLKAFGAGADVIGQIATDKAINGRRQKSSTFVFDITDGVLLEIALKNGAAWYPVEMSRVPAGAVILKSPSGQKVNVTDARRGEIKIWTDGPTALGDTLFWVT